MGFEKIGSIAMYAQMRTPKEPEKAVQGIQKFCADQPLSSIYTMGFEFAWVSRKGNQVIPFVGCRDYLQVTAWSSYTGIIKKVHTLTFDPRESPKVDLNNIRIGVRNKGVDSIEFKRYCKNSLALINSVEKEMGVPSSTLVFGGKFKDVNGVETDFDTWVFRGDSSWMRSIYHLSMYSLLIRAGANYTKGSWRGYLSSKQENFVSRNDQVYVITAMPGIEAIVKDKKHTLFAKLASDNFPKDVHSVPLHYEGIKLFATNSINPKLKVNWQDKEFKIDTSRKEGVKNGI